MKVPAGVLCVCVRECVFVCVCVRECEREREYSLPTAVCVLCFRGVVRTAV